MRFSAHSVADPGIAAPARLEDALLGFLGKLEPGATQIEMFGGLARIGRLVDIGMEPVDDETAVLFVLDQLALRRTPR